MNNGKINFNAGPAALPPEVILEVSEAVKEYNNTGMSILELPHRSKEFLDIVEESKALVKELCGIGNDYEVLWMQGGARLQFCMIPMNFLWEGKTAGYAKSGHWADEAIEYACNYGTIEVIANSEYTRHDRLPPWPTMRGDNLKYVHYTTNNTVYGTQYKAPPTYNLPLIADMSSDILSMERDYTKYALFYAAAQKNLGTPGNALVVIHKDFMKTENGWTPPLLSYKAQVKENSILSTANVSGVYTSLLMLRWIKARGMRQIEQDNKHKAQLLYNAIDNNDIFLPYVKVKEDRSIMNVCFTMPDKEKEQAFLAQCAANNIIGINGHRRVGGFRISLYNAIPISDVETLVEVMKSI